jgi:serine/threonine-protein kinase 24/25/MST4
MSTLLKLVNASLKYIHDDMDAREIESLSMLQRGFAELKEANPELTYNIILDMLQGINE